MDKNTKYDMIKISQILKYIFYNINYVQMLLDAWHKKTKFLKQTKKSVTLIYTTQPV
jgi:16S rRNA G527 N7-methylase RsmG